MLLAAGRRDLDAVLDAPHRRRTSRASCRPAWTARWSRAASSASPSSPSPRSSARASRPRSSCSGQATAAAEANAGAPARWSARSSASLIAVAIGYGFYLGARVINLQTFFRWTGHRADLHRRGPAGLRASTSSSRRASSRSGRRPRSTSAAVLPHERRHRRDGPDPDRRLSCCGRSSATPARRSGSTLIAWLAYLAVVLPLYLRPIKPAAPRPCDGAAGATA